MKIKNSTYNTKNIGHMMNVNSEEITKKDGKIRRSREGGEI